MDVLYWLVVGVAIVALVGVAILIRAQLIEQQTPATPGDSPTADSPLAVSTEGLKLCSRCGMGNLWTDRTCISCGGPLKG